MGNPNIIVVGGGNAAMCAALSARENGANVTILERAPQNEAGGNSRFTAGAIRTVYNGLADILALMPDLTEEERKNTDFGSYTEEQFFDDMAKVTNFRCDPDLTELLVRKSLRTLKWMQQKGIRFTPLYGRQAFKVDGKFKFWGGLTVEAWGGGPGLIDSLTNACRRDCIDIKYDARVLGLLTDDNGVNGVKVRQSGKSTELKSDAVILACGGFEADAEMRTRYLGPGWELARVRGTRFNTGDGIRMALEAGASSAGNWSGCHAVAWDRNAPEFGDLAVGDGFQKHSYPFGLIVNSEGKRFVDEGEDFRNYTYAKYGRAILEQPGQFAYQIFDSKVTHLLRDEYRIRQITKAQSDTLEGLAKQMEGIDEKNFIETVERYNAAVQVNIPFNPTIKDGRHTIGLQTNKTNWANTIDQPPYMAFGVTCGITFTFGGIRINTKGQVINSDGHVMPGLYAAGELVGGLFYFNYPGGTGLMSGAVFGRIAGSNSAKFST